MRGFLQEVIILWRNTGPSFGGKLQKKSMVSGKSKNTSTK
jgi:hypothetical protein